MDRDGLAQRAPLLLKGEKDNTPHLVSPSRGEKLREPHVPPPPRVTWGKIPLLPIDRDGLAQRAPLLPKGETIITIRVAKTLHFYKIRILMPIKYIDFRKIGD